MKKILSLILVLMMVLGLTIPAFAAASGTGTVNDPYLLSTLEVNDVIIATDYIKNDTEEILDYEVHFINSLTEQLIQMPIQPDPGETKQFTNSFYYPDNTQFSYKGFDATANFGNGAYVFVQITPEEEEGKSGNTDITLTVAKALTYDMVIPEDVTNLNAAGIYAVGQAKVENVENATEKTVISYTAETTAFKCEGKTDIPASYYTDAQGTTAFPTTAVEVYKSKADAASIPTMYVGISETDWDAAENGTYTATVTFNFSSEEVEAPAAVTAADVLTTDAEYKLNLTVMGSDRFSFTYKKTDNGFVVVKTILNEEDVTGNVTYDSLSDATGTDIAFTMAGGQIAVMLMTSTNTYRISGVLAQYVTFESFSVKPAGATEFTEVTLTPA